MFLFILYTLLLQLFHIPFSFILFVVKAWILCMRSTFVYFNWQWQYIKFLNFIALFNKQAYRDKLLTMWATRILKYKVYSIAVRCRSTKIGETVKVGLTVSLCKIYFIKFKQVVTNFVIQKIHITTLVVLLLLFVPIK